MNNIALEQPPEAGVDESGHLKRWAVLAAVGLGIVAALVPHITQRQDIINRLFLIFLYITLGQSWNILAGFAGQINLGHAAFFGIGALVTRTLWLNGMAFPFAFVLGGLTSMGFALLIGIPTFRLRGAYFAIGTLALAEVLRITVSNTNPLISTLPMDSITTYDLSARYYLALGLACATMLSTYLLLRSRLSLGIMALREDEDAAQATGVRTVQHKLLALAISSFFAGLAGATFAFYQVSYYPQAPFQPEWTFDALLVSFIGGLGTLIGPLLGAVFFITVREQLSLVVQAHEVVFGVLFIVIVLALPGGLVNIWARLTKLFAALRKRNKAIHIQAP
ncbi:MAG: branched-chain amino acid ABC transporter permease [Chloroflexota bacterium]